MLKPKQISNSIIKIVDDLNKVEQKDRKKATEQFAVALEKSIFEAIQSATITIPVGTIQVVTSNGLGSNIKPIILNLAIK